MSPTENGNQLAKRSVRSVSWTALSTLVSLPITFVQSIVLARLLPVEYFGVFAGVTSLILFSSTLFEFGLTNAFLHRAPETEDEEQAAAVYFTLRLISESLWALIVICVGWVAFTDLRRFVLIFLVISTYLQRLSQTPRILLIRRVEHRRLAILDLSTNILSAILSMTIAFYSRSIYALLISSVVSWVVLLIGFYFWKPIWRPRLALDMKVIRYYLAFGSKNLINNILDTALENLDYLWTNFFLGDMLLGFYSRAFKFATYPRLILSTPVNLVAIGTYAEAKCDRRRLSRAFFQTNALLVRTGFLFAGWLAVIAPEFIRLLIGEKWLPMLDTFRYMLIFCMLDPIRVSISSALVAVGKPEKITLVRSTQVMVLLIGLFSLGFHFGIIGVALAMNFMTIIGTVMALAFVRAYVDVSLWKLFAAPMAAIAAGFGLIWLSNPFIVSLGSDWLTGFARSLVFGLSYMVVLSIFEGEELLEAFKEILALTSIKQTIQTLKRRAF